MHAASRAADYLSDNFFHFFGSGKLALKIIEDRLQMEKCSNLVYDNNLIKHFIFSSESSASDSVGGRLVWAGADWMDAPPGAGGEVRGVTPAAHIYISIYTAYKQSLITRPGMRNLQCFVAPGPHLTSQLFAFRRSLTRNQSINEEYEADMWQAVCFSLPPSNIPSRPAISLQSAPQTAAGERFLTQQVLIDPSAAAAQ